ncbi:hypothetical protein [Streptacidiphilus anmyonensis]|uniref:hypothetical protein n=1 Tax=Streptacidiphilus anmyonensis TaxID=405782 RepID=UPI00128CB310|nr:hypothetical protein [Streptacidiphilus anmyonensis]
MRRLIRRLWKRAPLPRWVVTYDEVVYEGLPEHLPSAIEKPKDALARSAEPGLINELLAGGAVAASFTAASTVAKAKIEATTQRRKNELDAEIERTRIEAETARAALHEREETRRTRLRPQDPPATPAPESP